jgi:hypothetical protein
MRDELVARIVEVDEGVCEEGEENGEKGDRSRDHARSHNGSWTNPLRGRVLIDRGGICTDAISLANNRSRSLLKMVGDQIASCIPRPTNQRNKTL